MSSNTINFLRTYAAPLILLVNSDIGTLDRTRQEIQSELGYTILSIGEKLSNNLLTGQVSNMAATQSWLIDQVRNITPGPVVLVDIDLLFNPVFHLNPLSIFQQTSRFAKLVVLWPGTFSENKVLAYAVPEHNHYKTWKNPEANIFTIEE